MISWFTGKLQFVAGGAIALLAIFIYGYNLGSNNQKIKQIEAQIKLQQQADIKSAELAKNISDARLQNEQTIKLLQSNLDAAIASLRNRPNRRVSTAAAVACEGNTGSELSRPDSEFLVGLANDADIVTANLRACYAREEALRQAMCVAATGKPCL